MFQTRVVESGVSSFNGKAGWVFLAAESMTEQHWTAPVPGSGHLEGLKDIRRFLGNIVVGPEEYVQSAAVSWQKL